MRTKSISAFAGIAMLFSASCSEHGASDLSAASSTGEAELILRCAELKSMACDNVETENLAIALSALKLIRSGELEAATTLLELHLVATGATLEFASKSDAVVSKRAQVLAAYRRYRETHGAPALDAEERAAVWALAEDQLADSQ